MKTQREEKAEAQNTSASASLSNPICACGHRSTQHSYSADVESLDENLYCDICNCENFRNVSASLSKKQLLAHIDTDLLINFKILCLNQSKTIREALTEAIQDYILKAQADSPLKQVSEVKKIIQDIREDPKAMKQVRKIVKEVEL